MTSYQYMTREQVKEAIMRRDSEFRVFIDTLPPTSNHAYGVAVNKQARAFIYMTAEGKAWKDGAQMVVQAANDKAEGFWKGKQLYVSLTFFDKSVLTYDVDGRSKLALDAVAAGLGFNDRYVFPLLLDKRPSNVQGVLVFVTDRIPQMDRIPLDHVWYIRGERGKE